MNETVLEVKIGEIMDLSDRNSYTYSILLSNWEEYYTRKCRNSNVYLFV